MSLRIQIQDVVKTFGKVQAVDHITLDIEPGEFFTLLGPSGCGKTTLLRGIAGFNKLDGGEIRFGGKRMNDIPAHKRDIGMVFQNYAIFPHMTVAENVAYGLNAKQIPKDQIKIRVREALSQVQIETLADRKPNELSGGQQQRVALARAYIIEPSVLLMDEPLSNLDAKLRIQMRTIIKKLQRKLGITTIYVTHDQEEALAISDRIAVLQSGKVMQTGTPEEVYKWPENRFVAGFIGISNFLECRMAGEVQGKAVIETAGGFKVTMVLKEACREALLLAVRPEQLYFDPLGGIPATINFSLFLGDFVEYEVQCDDGQILQVNEYTREAENIRPDGEKVFVNFDPSRAGLYEKQTGRLLSVWKKRG
ncbi:MAG: ABC transporter ATP-binding protein [Enterocloster asparagiformis]|nr:ABC transporter ATP-binding protein [Enterocloster asparagiformis]